MSKESSDNDIPWKKLVIARSNDQWITTVKLEPEDTYERSECSEEYESEESGFTNASNSRLELLYPGENTIRKRRRKNSGPRPETDNERMIRLSKMSAYAANRLANETPEQRAVRLKRMSEYAARRLAGETPEQRERRLSRMSAYAARRLAGETPEQRSARLARMSAYAARRHAIKKVFVSENGPAPSQVGQK